MDAMTIIVIALCVVVVLIWFFMLIRLARFTNTFKECKSVTAKVVKVTKDSTGMPTAHLEYLTHNGKKTYKATGTRVPPRGEEYTKGQKLEMMWDPSHPKRLYRPNQDHLEGMKFFALTIVFMSLISVSVITIIFLY